MTNSTNKNQPGQPLLFVIFGATGDLAHRKLLPALLHLYCQGQLPQEFAIIAIGRRPLDDAAFRQSTALSLKEAGKARAAGCDAADFLQKVHYLQLDFTSGGQSYEAAGEWLRQAEAAFAQQPRSLYFLATAPEYFGLIVENLGRAGVLRRDDINQALLVEKPFGSDLASARALRTTISQWLAEKQIFRIDHYLGKEMIQNILAIRFGNSLFEPLWNHYYVDNIQIMSSETLGVEGRGGYYEQAGILKDMLQSHLLQMLALMMMEPPADLSAESIRDEKVKVLRALRPFESQQAGRDVILGQYGQGEADGKLLRAYRQEDKVDPASATPTFVALKAHVDNFRWGGVPVYIKAGKRLERQRTQIVVEFKRLPGVNYYPEFKCLSPNVLVIEVQPSEGMYFQINAKQPGNEFQMERVELNYCQNCRFAGNVPEAYERLILEAYRANASLFTRWDELEAAWEMIEHLQAALAATPLQNPNYAAGTRGPAAADEMLSRDGRRWWEIDPSDNTGGQRDDLL